MDRLTIVATYAGSLGGSNLVDGNGDKQSVARGFITFRRNLLN